LCPRSANTSRTDLVKEQVISHIKLIMASQQIKVTIVGAQGLRDTDGTTSEIFCVGEIHNKHNIKSGCFQTKAVRRNGNPVWNHEQLWTEYEEGDSIVFTLFATDRCHETLGRAELELDSGFRSQPFEGDLWLLNAGEGVKATLTVKAAVLDEAPFVIERVAGPMPLHDLVRPQDAPHECSQLPRTSEVSVAPKVTTIPSMVFGRSVCPGKLTPLPTYYVRGPVRQAPQTTSAAIPCANLPVRPGGTRAASVGGTGRLTPSFPFRFGTAVQQQRGPAHTYGTWTPPVPKSTFEPVANSQVRLVGPITTRIV
jgi:hypothetical protein